MSSVTERHTTIAASAAIGAPELLVACARALALTPLGGGSEALLLICP